jgi:predicted nucleic acid-binding protein
VDDADAGLLDTNVFIHAHTTDAHAEECHRFLAGLEGGLIRARLEPLIPHELSYALPRYVKRMSRQQVAEYLLMVLSWDGVEGEKDLMIETVQRWASTPGLSFADAHLAALANHRDCQVYTKYLREIRGQGIDAPDHLPDGT